jgi:hypothetical protein
METLGFTRCELDHALYRRAEGDEFLVVGVYVDDPIITGTSEAAINQFRQQMHELF